MTTPTLRPRRSRTVTALALLLTSFAATCLPALTWTVSKTADTNDGTCDADCSLREAIVAANANVGVDTIAFSIAGAGPHTIALTGSALPDLTGRTLVDASGEAISGAPGIRLDGSALASGNGLRFTSTAGMSTVSYLSITGFPGDGLVLESASNTITNCYVGVAPDGTTDAGNGGSGVVVSGASNIVGSAGSGNVVSGNGSSGIVVNAGSDGTWIRANRIGTNAAGTAALANAGYGLLASGGLGIALGGTAAGQGNLISGNGDNGIELGGSSSAWTVYGNTIGLDASGTLDLGNSGGGLRISSDNHIVGSSAAGGRNLISGNGYDGVALLTTSDGVQVRNNYLGTNAAGTAAVANGQSGLRIFGTNCTIGGTTSAERNLASGNGAAGISIESPASGCVVTGNYVGTNAAGTAALPNNGGVNLGGTGHTLGGDTAGERNLISGNNYNGVVVSGQNHLIQGNRIGTIADGSAALGNAGDGINGNTFYNSTIGGTNAGEGNLVSGNGAVGIRLGADSGNVTVRGNWVGVNAALDAALPNGGGISAEGSSHTIGGTTVAARNLISGNTFDGVTLAGIGHLVQGNYVGTDASGTAAIPNGLGIQATTATGGYIGGPTAGMGNLISGNTGNGVELGPSSSGVTIQGNKIGTNAAGNAALANGGGIRAYGSSHSIGGSTANERNLISGNAGNGVVLNGTSHLVRGNYVGTDVNGTADLGNAGVGVWAYSGSGHEIGGTSAGQGNLISGNGGTGINLNSDSSSCTVAGNKVGTNAAGTAAIANGGGVSVYGTGHTIGGSTAAARNVLSGNSYQGLYLTGAGHTISGNYIGLNAAGSAVLDNSGGAVRADTLVDSLFGGPTAAHGNVVAGSGQGLALGYGSTGNTVTNNVFGLDATAATNLDDNGTGIVLSNSPGNTIGLPGQGNVIAGYTYDGISLQGAATTGNLVQGNFIGTNQALAGNLGNAIFGIFVIDAIGNTIGGTGAGEGNVVANSGFAGIRVERGERNELSGNSIYGSGLLGIDVGEQYVWPNDGGDGDGGGNEDTNYPLLSSVIASAGSTAIQGMLINEPNTEYRVEFFSSPDCDPTGFGEGKTFRGSALVTTGGGGQAALNTSLPLQIADPFVTATVTDPDGNTSEFSPCAAVGGANAGKIQMFRSVFLGYEGMTPTVDVLVTRSHGLTGTVSASFTTSNSTAHAGTDYTDSDQTVTFAPWEVVKIVEVPILVSPAGAEGNPEKLLLALASPTGGATLGLAAADLLIYDQNPAFPGLAIDDAFVTEGNSGQTLLTFPVRLSATDHSVTVAYFTAPGTATESEDYEPVEDTITFSPSATEQTIEVSIPIEGDTEVEGDEIVWMVITVAPGNDMWIAFDTIGSGEIRDDDDSSPPPPNSIFADGFEIGTTALWSSSAP